MKRFSPFILFALIGLVVMSCRMANIATETPAASSLATLPVVETPLASPTPAPTSDPLASAKTCLANTWEVTDVSSSVIAAIPPEMVEQYNLQYKGTTGSGYYTLTENGDIVMQAEDLVLQFTAKASVFDVPVNVTIDGEARGQYSLDGDVLTTSNMDTSGMTATAQALGQDIVDQETILNAFPLINPPHNRAVYTCSGNNLSLKLPSYPESVPPVVFAKVE
jgi:hypothetical protein